MRENERIPIIFYGKLPPPLTGMTIANKQILSFLSEQTEVHIVNYSQGALRPSGVSAIFYNIRQLGLAIKKNRELRRLIRQKGKKRLYFVGSPSFFGNLLDIYRTRSVVGSDCEVFMHLHTGNWIDNLHSFRLFGGGKTMLKRVHHILALSEGLKDQFKGVFPEDRIQVVPNTIASEMLCSSDEVEAKMQRTNKRKTVLYLSNFIPSKGYALLIEALEQMEARQPDTNFFLRMIGAFPSEKAKEEVQKRVAQSSIQAKIDLIGPLRDRSRVREIFMDADIFCLPTYYPQEAQPLVLLEAMNAACAIVASRHASIPEFIDHERNGLLVEKKNTEELSHALEELIMNDDSMISLARAARKTFSERFSEEAQELKLREVFGLG